MKDLSNFESKSAPSVSDKKEEDYQAEEDARILEKFSQIIGNPVRHKRAQAKLSEKMASLKKAHTVMKRMPRTRSQKEFEEDREASGARRY